MSRKLTHAGWDVLLDAAAFAPTNRLDVARIRPDFVTLSFYKMFGFPTGIGCLLMRRERINALARPWFAGGTITIASVQGDGHYLHRDEAGFEDGTVDYLNLPAVETGLRHIERIGLDSIHERVVALTSWLLGTLTELRHSNGRSVVQIHGPTDTSARGGTVTFSMFDRDGRPIDDRRVEELANRRHISLRTGCFCNPGAGEIAHGLGAREMGKWFEGDEPLSYLDLRDRLLAEHDVLVAAIRVSMGVATNFADVYRFTCFMQEFVNRSVEEIGGIELTTDDEQIDAPCRLTVHVPRTIPRHEKDSPNDELDLWPGHRRSNPRWQRVSLGRVQRTPGPRRSWPDHAPRCSGVRLRQLRRRCTCRSRRSRRCSPSTS